MELNQEQENRLYLFFNLLSSTLFIASARLFVLCYTQWWHCLLNFPLNVKTSQLPHILTCSPIQLMAVRPRQSKGHPLLQSNPNDYTKPDSLLLGFSHLKLGRSISLRSKLFSSHLSRLRSHFKRKSTADVRWQQKMGCKCTSS